MDDGVKIAITALVTTIGTALVAVINHRMSERKDRKSKEEDRTTHAVYLAVRVVCVLDKFVAGCCEVIGDDGVYDPEGARHHEVEPPVLTLPDDVDWRSIRPELMYRVLMLPNEIENAGNTIAFVGNMVAFPPDYDEWFDERRYQYGKLGLYALDLASALRSAYDLPMADYSRWNPRPHLEAAFVREDAMRRLGAEAASQIAKGSGSKEETPQ